MSMDHLVTAGGSTHGTTTTLTFAVRLKGEELQSDTADAIIATLTDSILDMIRTAAVDTCRQLEQPTCTCSSGPGA